MYLALLLFVITALGGCVLLAMRVLERNPPLPLALGHGALGVAGLVALGLHLGRAGWTPLPGLAFLLLIGAAAGGVVVLSYHLRGARIPVRLSMLHAWVAVAGVALLVAAVITDLRSGPA